jgi:hypothetical protein
LLLWCKTPPARAATGPLPLFLPVLPRVPLEWSEPSALVGLGHRWWHAGL